MRQGLLACVVVMLTIVFAASPALKAAPIPNPDAAYQASTTLINISGIPNSTVVNSITDGVLNVGFSAGMQKLQVPGSWGTWNLPPNAETSTPAVLYSNGQTSLVITLSQGVGKFGLELEPNPQSAFMVTATFSNGDVVTRLVSGLAGSLLFASGGAGAINSVSISSPVDFAIAQIRYGLATAGVPEPASMLTWGLIAGACCAATRIRRWTSNAA